MRERQPQPISKGRALRYTLPPRVLWVSRTEDEYHLAVEEADHSGDNKVEAEAVPPDNLVWERFAAPPILNRVIVSPALPDRPLVVRPAATMSIVQGHTTRLFVSIPVWWHVALSTGEGPATPLSEYPSTVLSKSWFGQPFAGESCYALKTRARHDLDDLSSTRNRATCSLTLRNRASEPLLFERFCLRAPFLALYSTPDGRLWTGDVHVIFRGADEPAQVDHRTTPPADIRDTEVVCRARSRAPKGFTSRAFDHFRSMSGIF